MSDYKPCQHEWSKTTSVTVCMGCGEPRPTPPPPSTPSGERMTLAEAMLNRALRAEASEKALREALEESLDSWEEAAQYKGDYLREKHGDAERIAELRATLAKQP